MSNPMTPQELLALERFRKAQEAEKAAREAEAAKAAEKKEAEPDPYSTEGQMGPGGIKVSD